MGLVTPTRFSTLSSYCGAAELNATPTVTLADYNWPAQNQAVIIPFSLPWPYLVTRIFWRNGSGGAGANWDVGIYDGAYAQLYHTTSTASSGNSAMQYVTLSTALQLPTGRYFLAIAQDSATLTNRAQGISTITANEGRLGGLQQMAAAFPLPATLVPAQWASTGLPIVGVARSASGP